MLALRVGVSPRADLPPGPGPPAPNFRLASFKSPTVPHLLLCLLRGAPPGWRCRRPRPRAPGRGSLRKTPGRGRDGNLPGEGTRVISEDPGLGDPVAAGKEGAAAGGTRRPGGQRLPGGRGGSRAAGAARGGGPGRRSARHLRRRLPRPRLLAPVSACQLLGRPPLFPFVVATLRPAERSHQPPSARRRPASPGPHASRCPGRGLGARAAGRSARRGGQAKGDAGGRPGDGGWPGAGGGGGDGAGGGLFTCRGTSPCRYRTRS